MAPDLNTLGSGQKWDYSTPGSNGYEVPNIVYDVSEHVPAKHSHTNDATRILPLGS